MQQIELNYEGGLNEQFPDFNDCVRASVYSCGRPLKAIAADLDMSVSELSRKLANNPNDPVHFQLKRLPDLLQATDDLRPLYWLFEKFCQDDTQRRKQAVEALIEMLPKIQSLLQTANDDQ